VAHKFRIGQSVELVPNRLRMASAGSYEIRHLMPASDANPGNPTYRVKSMTEKHDRVVAESDLTPASGAESVFRA
jgi:hypothetical protein